MRKRGQDKVLAPFVFEKVRRSSEWQKKTAPAQEGQTLEPPAPEVSEAPPPPTPAPEELSQDRRKACVSDQKGQYEKQRLSQEWK